MVHEKNAGMARAFGLFNRDASRMDRIQKRQGSYLPHWTQDAGCYAISFRLADSLPRVVLQQWQNELGLLQAKNRAATTLLSLPERNRLQQLLSERVQKYLDNGEGHCWLTHESAAQIVRDCLAYFHGKQYWIHAWCIMPNHVHVVVELAPGEKLPKVVQAWKSNSSRRIGKILPIEQPFWQAEYYDHLIRDEADFLHAVAYILRNPDKAGLKRWRWVGREFAL